MKNCLRWIARSLSVVVALMVVCGCGSDSTGPANQAPSITQVAVDPATVQAGGTTTVTVTATDPDGDVLTYGYVPNGGAITGTGATVTWTVPIGAGAYSVAATVSDDAGLSATQTAGVTVTAAPTRITGTAALEVGQAGDLSNSRVALYADLTDYAAWAPALTMAATGSGASVSFTFDDLPPGTYYLDVWKDIDNSGDLSNGDFYGWHGSQVYPDGSLTPLAISEGQTETTSITVVEAAIINPIEINGTATMLDGQVGDLANARVALFASEDDFNNDVTYAIAAPVGAGTSIDYVFAGIDPGTYFLEIWKDINANNQIDAGDLYGYHGDVFAAILYGIEVDLGDIVTADADVFVIQAAFDPKVPPRKQ